MFLRLFLKQRLMRDELPKTESAVTETVVITETVVRVEEKVPEPAVAEKTKVMMRVALWKAFADGWKSLGGRVASLDRTTKSFIVVFGVFAVLLVLFNAFKGQFIAATVNGSSISRWSLIQELEKQSGKSTLDTMITKKLIAFSKITVNN